MTRLTENQKDAMRTLNNYVGQTVDVLTSEYTANVAPDFVRSAVGIFKSPALRGLEAKGYIEFDAFWKGGTVKVLKAVEV